mgnify:FL=1
MATKMNSNQPIVQPIVNQPKPKCCADCFVVTDNPNWEETAQCVQCELNDENETEDKLTISIFEE